MKKQVEEGSLGWVGAIDNLFEFFGFFRGKYAHWEREGALGWVVDGVLVVLPHFRLLLVSTTDDLDVSGSQVFLTKPTSFWMWICDGSDLLDTLT